MPRNSAPPPGRAIPRTSPAVVGTTSGSLVAWAHAAHTHSRRPANNAMELKGSRRMGREGAAIRKGLSRTFWIEENFINSAVHARFRADVWLPGKLQCVGGRDY